MIKSHIFSIIVLIASIALLIYGIYKIRTRKFGSLTQCILQIMVSISLGLSVSLPLFFQATKSINIVGIILASMSMYPFFDDIVRRSCPNLYKKND